MAEIKWEERFSVGVKELDEQHKKIIEIINRLSRLIEAGNFSDQELQNILEELSNYAHYHFTNEEIYFREFDYNQTEPHVKEHDDYRQKMKELKNDYAAGRKKQVLFDLFDFINNWWVWHINHIDKEYTECFHRHGLA